MSQTNETASKVHTRVKKKCICDKNQSKFADKISSRIVRALDFFGEIVYNINSYGAAKVSTGILRYDKRGGQDNPVKMSNLKNKRQQ